MVVSAFKTLPLKLVRFLMTQFQYFKILDFILPEVYFLTQLLHLHWCQGTILKILIYKINS